MSAADPKSEKQFAKELQKDRNARERELVRLNKQLREPNLYNKSDKINQQTAAKVESWLDGDTTVQEVSERMTAAALCPDPLQVITEAGHVVGMTLVTSFDGATRKTKRRMERHSRNSHFNDPGAKWLATENQLDYWMRIGEEWISGSIEPPAPVILMEEEEATMTNARTGLSEGFLHVDSVFAASHVKYLNDRADGKVLVWVVRSDSGGSTFNTHYHLCHSVSDYSVLYWPILCEAHFLATCKREAVEFYLDVSGIDVAGFLHDFYCTVNMQMKENGAAAMEKAALILKDKLRHNPNEGSGEQQMEAGMFRRLVDHLDSKNVAKDEGQQGFQGGIFRDGFGYLVQFGSASKLECNKEYLLQLFASVTPPVWTRWLTYWLAAVRYLLVVIFFQSDVVSFKWMEKGKKRHSHFGNDHIHVYFSEIVARPITLHSMKTLQVGRIYSRVERNLNYEKAVDEVLEFLSNRDEIYNDVAIIYGIDPRSLTKEQKKEIGECCSRAWLAIHAGRGIMEARVTSGKGEQERFLLLYESDPEQIAGLLVVPVTNMTFTPTAGDPGSMAMADLQKKAIMKYRDSGWVEYQAWLALVVRMVLSVSNTNVVCERKIGSYKRMQSSTNCLQMETLNSRYIQKHFTNNLKAAMSMRKAVQRPCGRSVSPKPKRQRDYDVMKKITWRNNDGVAGGQQLSERNLQAAMGGETLITKAAMESASREYVSAIERNDVPPLGELEDSVLPPSSVVMLEDAYYQKVAQLCRNWWSVASRDEARRTLSELVNRCRSPLQLSVASITIRKTKADVLAAYVVNYESGQQANKKREAEDEDTQKRLKLRRVLNENGFGDMAQVLAMLQQESKGTESSDTASKTVQKPTGTIPNAIGSGNSSSAPSFLGLNVMKDKCSAMDGASTVVSGATGSKGKPGLLNAEFSVSSVQAHSNEQIRDEPVGDSDFAGHRHGVLVLELHNTGINGKQTGGAAPSVSTMVSPQGNGRGDGAARSIASRDNDPKNGERSMQIHFLVMWSLNIKSREQLVLCRLVRTGLKEFKTTSELVVTTSIPSQQFDFESVIMWGGRLECRSEGGIEPFITLEEQISRSTLSALSNPILEKKATQVKPAKETTAKQKLLREARQNIENEQKKKGIAEKKQKAINRIVKLAPLESVGLPAVVNTDGAVSRETIQGEVGFQLVTTSSSGRSVRKYRVGEPRYEELRGSWETFDALLLGWKSMDIKDHFTVSGRLASSKTTIEMKGRAVDRLKVFVHCSQLKRKVATVLQYSKDWEVRMEKFRAFTDNADDLQYAEAYLSAWALRAKWVCDRFEENSNHPNVDVEAVNRAFSNAVRESFAFKTAQRLIGLLPLGMQQARGKLLVDLATPPDFRGHIRCL